MASRKIVRLREMVLGLIVAFIALECQIIDWAFGDGCRVPNPNEKFCEPLPKDARTICGGVAQEDCTGKIYEIENFPDGTYPSKSGTTSEVQASCIKSKSCYWDASSQEGKCVAPADFGVPAPATKIVVGDKDCPPKK